VPSGVLVYVAGHYIHGFLKDGATILISELAVAVAILAMVLMALSILLAFIGDDYLYLLRKSIGVSGAIYPYKLVAVVSGSQLLVSLAGLLVWNSVAHTGQSVLLACASGLLVWCVVGTIQLIFMTAWHAQQRSRLPEVREEFERGQREARGVAGH
jgi:Na+/proline symporter